MKAIYNYLCFLQENGKISYLRAVFSPREKSDIIMFQIKGIIYCVKTDWAGKFIFYPAGQENSSISFKKTDELFKAIEEKL